jgi:hypothetical protein
LHLNRDTSNRILLRFLFSLAHASGSQLCDALSRAITRVFSLIAPPFHRRNNENCCDVRGARREYSAAVDLGVWDLTPRQVSRLSGALARQGFASFYRRGGKWRGNEHIHAVYVMLPMKSQLRRQVREFLRRRRNAGLPRLRWEKKLRRRGYARG